MLDYKLDLDPRSRSQLLAMDRDTDRFPLSAVECGRFYASKGFYTKRDGMNYSILLYTREGCGYVIKNGQSALLKRDQAILIDCAGYHEYRTYGDGIWDFRWAHIAGSGIGCYSDTLLLRPLPIDVDVTDDMDRCFDALERIDAGEGIYSLAAMNAVVGEMLLIMLRSQAGEDIVRRDVARLAEYIRANSEEELHIDRFAEVMNLSKYYLIRLFHQYMGTTPYKYLHRCRVRRAEELLRTTYMSVEEIAEAVGYSDSVNFIRHFRSVAGTTPSRYRRETMDLIIN